MNKRNIQAVIFDMDGVLIDSMTVLANAAIEVFAEWDCAVEADDLKRYAGQSREMFQEGIAEQFGLQCDWHTFYRRLNERTSELILEVQPMKGVFHLLQELRDHDLKTGLATSAHKATLTFYSGKYGFHNYFDAMLCANDVYRTKPDPEIFLKTAEQLMVDPESCAVVEDAVSGIQAANQAGMYSIALSSTFLREELSDAHHIIDQLNEIDSSFFQSLQ